MGPVLSVNHGDQPISIQLTKLSSLLSFKKDLTVICADSQVNSHRFTEPIRPNSGLSEPNFGSKIEISSPFVSSLLPKGRVRCRKAEYGQMECNNC